MGKSIIPESLYEAARLMHEKNMSELRSVEMNLNFALEDDVEISDEDLSKLRTFITAALVQSSDLLEQAMKSRLEDIRSGLDGEALEQHRSIYALVEERAELTVSISKMVTEVGNGRKK